MRTKLGQNVEEMLQRDDVLGKLDHLREITSKLSSPQGIRHGVLMEIPRTLWLRWTCRLRKESWKNLRVVGQALNTEVE